MLEKLKRFWQGDPPPVSATIADPVLGVLTWSEDDEAWQTERSLAGFVIHVSGTPTPDARLLAHAAELVKSREAFVAEVLAQVRHEADSVSSLRPYRDEMLELKLDHVSLPWPDRPDDGLISLEGGRDYRAWRCDLIAGKPHGVGFDS